MFQADQNVWCIYFQSFSDKPLNKVFKRSENFLNFAKSIFDSNDLSPTHHLASHLDRKLGYREYSDKRLRNSIQSFSDRLMGIELANIAAANDYHNWNLRVAEYENCDRSISIMIQLKYVKPYHIDDYISKISEMGPWDRGFAFKRRRSKAPEIFMLGTAFYSEKGLSKTEKNILEEWEILPAGRKQKILRDLFPINIIDLEMKERVNKVYSDRELQIEELSHSLFKFPISKANKRPISKKLKEAGLLL